MNEKLHELLSKLRLKGMAGALDRGDPTGGKGGRPGLGGPLPSPA